MPHVETDDTDESRRLYVDVLGFDVAMEMDGIIMLASPSNETAQITLYDRDRAPRPRPHITIEVDDVDAVHDAVTAARFEVTYSLTDEPWGVRRFFVRDPNGVVVNVMTHR